MSEKKDTKMMPDKAIRAILNSETIIKLSNDNILEVKPVSISTMAVLDMIKSPMLYPNDKISIYDYIPSFYAIINGYKICMKSENIVEDAFDFFDKNNISLQELEKIKDACFKQLYIATELTNDGDNNSNKKK